MLFGRPVPHHVIRWTREWLVDHFELSRGANHNVRAMEGLRGLAVFLVFFVHFGAQANPYLPVHSLTSDIESSLMTMGNAGVDLFFVLSGYLIYGKLISRPQALLTFMRRRLERIYPTFVAVFVTYLVFSALRPSENKIPDHFPDAIGFLAANFFLLPGLFPITAMITQAWSLSYEIFFYLAIPTVIAVTGMRAWQPWPRIATFLIITAGFIAYSSIEGGHVRLIMFVSGIVLYEVVRNRLFQALPGAFAPVVVAGGLALLLAPLNGAAWYSLKIVGLFVCFFILCHVCFTRPTAWVTKLMDLTPIRWFGNMSYSYYLMHGLALKALFIVVAALPASFHNSALYWVLLPAALAVTIVPSGALFLFIERPFSLSPALEKRAERETGGDEPAAAPERPLPTA